MSKLLLTTATICSLTVFLRLILFFIGFALDDVKNMRKVYGDNATAWAICLSFSMTAILFIYLL